MNLSEKLGVENLRKWSSGMVFVENGDAIRVLLINNKAGMSYVGGLEHQLNGIKKWSRRCTRIKYIRC
jgi:hypothetical protein